MKHSLILNTLEMLKKETANQNESMSVLRTQHVAPQLFHTCCAWKSRLLRQTKVLVTFRFN